MSVPTQSQPGSLPGVHTPSLKSLDPALSPPSRQLTQLNEKFGDPSPADPPVSRWRAWTLLFIFSMAQMLDIFNVTAPTIALPHIAEDLGVLFAERQWAINAYSLTFGAFLLTGGSFSAIFGPKNLFVFGFTMAGICAIINGFSINGPMLFIFRAIQGIGAAMTIPSALTMITSLFPNHREQDRALGIYAAFGAVGNVSGLILGGVISQLLSWRWVFWILSMLTIPLSLVAFALAPSDLSSKQRKYIRLRDMDWIGLGTITLSLILFVYSITEGNNHGWTSSGILAPLLISIALMPTFGYIEMKVQNPLVPPGVWTLPMFVPLFFLTMSVYLIMNVVIFQESLVFQQVWHSSALSAALRIIPFGITGFIVTISTGHITPYVAPRWVLIVGELLMLGGTLLVAFAPTPDQYWPKVLPGLVLTALGVSSVFVAANIGMLRTPLGNPSLKLSESTALIGAIFNADLQFGSALGLAISTAITTTVNGPTGGSNFAGYKASYWFVVGLAVFEVTLAAFALKDKKSLKCESAESTVLEPVSKALDISAVAHKATGTSI